MRLSGELPALVHGTRWACHGVVPWAKPGRNGPGPFLPVLDPAIGLGKGGAVVGLIPVSASEVEKGTSLNAIQLSRISSLFQAFT